MPFTVDEIDRYARQILLPEWGAAGQERVRDATVVVRGRGAAADTAALYLRAAGVGRVENEDEDENDDVVVLANGARITASGDRVAIGAAVAVEALKAILGRAHRSRVTLLPDA